MQVFPFNVVKRSSHKTQVKSNYAGCKLIWFGEYYENTVCFSLEIFITTGCCTYSFVFLNNYLVSLLPSKMLNRK